MIGPGLLALAPLHLDPAQIGGVTRPPRFKVPRKSNFRAWVGGGRYR